jgi:hypothetical protein
MQTFTNSQIHFNSDHARYTGDNTKFSLLNQEYNRIILSFYIDSTEQDVIDAVENYYHSHNLPIRLPRDAFETNQHYLNGDESIVKAFIWADSKDGEISFEAQPFCVGIPPVLGTTVNSSNMGDK